MGTQCYALVRGSAIRVTGLDARGAFNETAIRYAVSKTVARVAVNEVTEPGSNEVLKNDVEERRIILRRPDTLIRYTLDIDFLRVDPGILALVAGVPLVSNAGSVIAGGGFGEMGFGTGPFGTGGTEQTEVAGDIVGFDANTRRAPAAFALEVWTKIAGVCTTGQRQWGYTLFPFNKGGRISGFTFANGLVSFNLKGAATQRSGTWGDGPYQLAPTPTPVSGNTAWRQTLTSLAPPAQTNGIVVTADSIEGGTASMTTEDILDGEHVVTSPQIVDGGLA